MRWRETLRIWFVCVECEKSAQSNKGAHLVRRSSPLSLSLSLCAYLEFLHFALNKLSNSYYNCNPISFINYPYKKIQIWLPIFLDWHSIYLPLLSYFMIYILNYLFLFFSIFIYYTNIFRTIIMVLLISLICII